METDAVASRICQGFKAGLLLPVFVEAGSKRRAWGISEHGGRVGHGARLHQQLVQEEMGGRLEPAAEQEGNWLKGAEGDAQEERALDARGEGFDTAREARLKKKNYIRSNRPECQLLWKP